MKSCLLLFDIDGTMLDTGGAGMEALRGGFADAFPDAYRSGEFPRLELGGATDGGLLSFLLESFGMPQTPDHEETFYLCYLKRLKPALEESFSSGRGRQLSGVANLVSLLSESQHNLGLLTGNIGRAALLKLESFGYDSGPFEVGAYGDDHADRNRLGPIAIDRARKSYGRSFSPEKEVYVIGDTVKDIACARACGARVIAVATGACDYETLAGANPDYLFEDFEDYESVLETTGLG